MRYRAGTTPRHIVKRPDRFCKPISFPAFETSVGKRHQGTVSLFPEPDFSQVFRDTRPPSNRDHIRNARGEPSFTITSMTPCFTHEINRTVAARAAEMSSSPTVADKSCVTWKAQPAIRPLLPYARLACFKGIKRVDDTRKHGGVLAFGRVTRTTGRRMV